MQTITEDPKNMASPEEGMKALDFEKEAPDHRSWMLELAEMQKTGKYKGAVAVKELLIVEDDENNSELLQALLRYHGIESSVAINAEEAIEYCQRYEPMGILMDIGLAGTNGLEVTHILKQMPMMEDVPFIAVSAHDSARMRDLAEEAGCTLFIAKPWSSEEIMDAIANHCSMA